MKKNEKGLSSIILGIYLLIILVIMGSVMYGSVYMTSTFATRQLDSFQNDYNLERGVYYAVDYISKHPSTEAVTNTWDPWTSPEEGAHIVMNGTLAGTDPDYVKYAITSSTPAGAPATRPGRTVTVEYDKGKITSYTVSSAQ